MQRVLRGGASLPLPWRAALALLAGLVLLATFFLWHLRRAAIDGESRQLALISAALTNEIHHGLEGAEEGMRAIRDQLRDGDLPTRGAEARRALQSAAALMPLVQTLWLLAPDGRVVAASEASAPPERRQFRPALDRLDESAIAMSGAFDDPARKAPFVALAIRYADPSGAIGWIVAGIPASKLLGAFATAADAGDVRMAVFRDDGSRLAGSLVATPLLGIAETNPRRAASPVVERRRLSDGSDRLVAVSGVPRYGMRVMLTRNMKVVLATWRETAWLTAAGIVLIVAIAAIAAYTIERANRRRLDAQRALESQLARAGKLEALGTLAGGVAHDFNNILAAILGYAEMARDAAPPRSGQLRHLDKLLQAALRGRSLVERILTFSRGATHASRVFELEPVVEEVLSLMAASLRPGIVLERRLDARGAKLRGDPTQAFEAVMNLCTNALQAMPDSGMLSVRLERRHVATPALLSHGQAAPGDYVVLTVADQGSGIAPDVMERLFEPFFSTRGTAGVGLGLAVVHGVVVELGGAIDVRSAPGSGARFTLWLPECTDAIDSGADAAPPLPIAAGQSLLVVDDEPTLVALAEEMLSAMGYAPVGCTDPVSALAAVREAPERFAAVITDEVMPKLSGTQLTAALRELAPALPVLLVSGYGGAMLASRAALVGVTRVLHKPLERDELARALAELLR